MAAHLTDPVREIPFSDDLFARTETLSRALYGEIEQFLQNQTWKQDVYFMHYVNMRREQCMILQRIYDQLSCLTQIPEQAQPLAALFSEIVDQYHEENDCQTLLERLDELHTAYCQDVLPKTREEFENRAILYCILTGVQMFLQQKQHFYRETAIQHPSR